MRHDPSSLGILLAVLCAISGCNSGDGVEAPISQQNIRHIGDAYAEMAREGKPPTNLDELKPYLKKRGDDIDKMLISENDGEPFVIIYGVDPKAYVGKQIPVTVYEKSGKRGKRLVFQGSVFHMADEDLKKAPFPQGKSPF